MASIFVRAVRKASRIARRRLKQTVGSQKVAVIGCGRVSGEHFAGFDGTSSALVVAGSDLSAAALAAALDDWPALRVFRDTNQMLAEIRPDLVSVCTWPQEHAEHVRAAAHAGAKGILCEKPIALSLAEIDEMIEVCRQAGTKLGCGHQYRFHPVFELARQQIQAGALGKVRQVRGAIRGSLANNGPHLVDTVRFVLGDMPAEQVEFVCRRAQPVIERGLPCEESGNCTITFAGHIVAELETGHPDPSTFWIEVTGTAGVLRVTPGSLEINGQQQTFDRDATLATARARQFGEFVEWTRGKRATYAADAAAAALTAEIVLAGYESVRSGESVELPLKNRGDVLCEAFGVPAPTRESPAAPRSAETKARNADGRLAIDGGQQAIPRWFSPSPVFGLSEWKNVAGVMRSRELNRVGCEVVAELERNWAAYYGSPMAVASTSGTSAIHVALAAVNPEPCQEVITTPVSDMGTVIPILACNCIPVFADIDPATGNMTAETIARAMTPRTRAVILVHLFGRPADLRPIVELCRSRGIALIEDCAQAHAARFAGQNIGTFGDFGCFSLQQSKQITCGDGGITIVNRPEYFERARYFVDKGWTRSTGRNHRFLGMNYRMTELQGAVALAQLARLPQLMNNRRARARELVQALRSVPGVLLPPPDERIEGSWWKFPIGVDEATLHCTIDEFYDALRVEGVRMMRTYLPRPLFEEEMFRAQRTYGESGYPFTAVDYKAPERHDFPGLLQFLQNWLLIDWTNRVRTRHVAGISQAVQKVAGHYSRHHSPRTAATPTATTHPEAAGMSPVSR